MKYRKLAEAALDGLRELDGVADRRTIIREDYENDCCDRCDASGIPLREIGDWIESIVDYDDLEWREQEELDGLCDDGWYVCKNCAKKLINRALRAVERRENGYIDPDVEEASMDDPNERPEGWEAPETFQDDNPLPDEM